MPAMLLLLAQAVSPPIDFDLAKLPPRPPDCHRPVAAEILVCGRAMPPPSVRDDQRFTRDPLLPKAEIGLIGKSTIGIATQAAQVGGFTSNRVMVHVKIPF